MSRFLSIAVLVLLPAGVIAQEKDLTAFLREWTPPKHDEETRKAFAEMLSRDARDRIRQANQRESEAWKAIKTRDDWERYSRPKIEALRRSLGTFPTPPKEPKVRIARTLEGDGYRIDNLVFESRPGLWVTANLYRPAKPGKSAPGFLLCHSHHAPKTQVELQDMGVMWAKAGGYVLSMDHLGHGERRQHPFLDEKSYPKTFRPSRQDYYFRYNEAIQLYLIGDSLMGWMVWDMMRGVDVLLAQPGIDREKIVLLGAVAGGGDPAAVAAALDDRIKAVAPFNFGGPQPETVYPLPENAETTFNYAGGGSWESTRNLRLSARDGFLPWVIVGSVAPRRLIYGHEFAWDKERDPVWARLEKIYQLYKVPDHQAFAHGKGKLSGQPPESTHCTNIGPEHRVLIHQALKKWYDIPVSEKEPRERRTAAELTCWTPELQKELNPKPLWQLARSLGQERADAAGARLAKLEPAARRKQLREDWMKLLGDVNPRGAARPVAKWGQEVAKATVEGVPLQVEPGISVPLVLLRRDVKPGTKMPVVVGVCQQGKDVFLKQRATEIAKLLDDGIAVCVVDVRGTGETRAGSGRGRSTSATSIMATELMLGQTMLGSQLRDLRSVLAWLRERKDIDGKQMMVWGESFAPVNAKDAVVAVPLDAEQPQLAEPAGALLALFAALFEDELVGVVAGGGLPDFAAMLKSPFVHVPFDSIVPGALTAGDLSEVAKALAGRVLTDRPVDGHNHPVGKSELDAPTWMMKKLKE